jgi:hypothetical protein
VPPRFPGGGNAATGPRRAVLAGWVTSPSNPYFARNAVNLIWAQLFGEKLVPSLDRLDGDAGDFRRELLDLLAADFAASGYDLKRLLRVVVHSRAYQLGSASGEGSEVARHALRKAFAVYPARPLDVDPLYHSMVQATGFRAPDGLDAEAQAKADEANNVDRPVAALGERALTVQRSLVLLNGDHVHKAAQAGARLVTAAYGARPGPAHLEWLFLATLSRRPTAEEAAPLLELMKAGGPHRGPADVLWTLLNSAEFNTQH